MFIWNLWLHVLHPCGKSHFILSQNYQYVTSIRLFGDPSNLRHFRTLSDLGLKVEYEVLWLSFHRSQVRSRNSNIENQNDRLQEFWTCTNFAHALLILLEENKDIVQRIRIRTKPKAREVLELFFRGTIWQAMKL